MREFARCLAWATGLGALALLLALFVGGGIEHADGLWAGVLFALFWPRYLLGHHALAWSQAALPAVGLLAQFAYFLALAAAVRAISRGKPRWRPARQQQ